MCASAIIAKVVPAYGGDTLFASMTAAYTGLSERMKQYIHGLEAIHDFKPWRHLFTSSEAHQAKLRELERQFPNPSHPVVRIHPWRVAKSRCWSIAWATITRSACLKFQIDHSK